MSATLTMLDERGAFGMSFIITTEHGELIVIDGGMTEDTPHLLEYIGGKRISAWFLTHPHLDHITAFMDIMEFHPSEIDLDRVYYNFPPLSYVQTYEPQEAFTQERFERLLPAFSDRAQVVKTGDLFRIDGVTVEILYHYLPDKATPPQCALNSTSLVFKVTTDTRSMLFLGDCDPTSGDILLERQCDKLKSDFVQMAHHGHSGVSCDVYMAIDPQACFWCAPDWLYDEAPAFFGDRLYGVRRQREWMDKMGVKTHYVTKDGTQTVTL